MEKKRFTRFVGIMYVIGAVLGLLVCLSGLIFLWATRDEVTGALTNTVRLADRTIASTREMIVVVGGSLDEASRDLGTVQSLLLDSAETLDDSGKLIQSTGDLINGQMVEFVGDTQASLQSVQNSARMVDNVLNTINSIPLLGPWLGGGYKPDVPLQASVQQVNESLDPLPDSFHQMARDLDVAAANASILRSEVETLAGQIDNIQTSVKDAQQVVSQYRTILLETQQRFERFAGRLPAVINVVYLVVTLVLVWGIITQVGMLANGINLLS